MESINQKQDKKRVIILGAGSAGLNAAIELDKAFGGDLKAEVILIDQHNYHLFQPLLYQVGTGGLEPGHICFPVRSLLKNGGNGTPIRFIESRIENIDLDKKVVITEQVELTWDELVIALGSTTNYFGLTEVEKGAMSLKSLRDGIDIHNRILDCYEKAFLTEDEQRRKELLTFVVVGGGATGVELTASIQDYVSKVLVRDFPSLTPFVRVILIEARGRILSEMKDQVMEVAVNRLRTQGVELLLNTAVSKVWSEGIETTEGQIIPTHTVIWVAGVKPVPIVDSLPLNRASDGRITIDRNMESSIPGVYVLGDCAYLTQNPGPEPYPPTGQIAVRQGIACARNIINTQEGKPRLPFLYKYKGELISMGRNVAVAQIGNMAFDGFPAWLLWRIYYLNMLMGFKSKLSVALDWSFAYIYRRNTARLE